MKGKYIYPFNMEELEILCKKYGFIILFNHFDIVHIQSKFDEWRITRTCSKFKLFHKNRFNIKAAYHIHNSYVKLEEAFQEMSKHDNYLSRGRHKNINKMNKHSPRYRNR